MSAYSNDNVDDDDDDDLLASLGGSLFNDLLADLQAEDNDVLGGGGGAGNGGAAVGWLSLEQLEQELSHLDAKGSSSGGGATLFGSNTADAGRDHFHLPPLSAASLVVDRHHAQAQLLQQQQQHPSSSIQQLLQTTTVTMVAPPQHADAWSLSWQQFGDTAQDFLQADAATRKQQEQQQQTSVLPVSSSIDFSQAQEYNISEQPRISPDVLAPPPGMARGERQSQPQPEATVSATTGTAAAASADVTSTDLLQQAANKLLKDLQQQQPPPQALSDANTAEPTVLAPIDESMAVPASPLPSDQGPPVTTLPKFSKPALTPQNSVTLGPDGQVLTMTVSQQQQQQQPSPGSSTAPPMPPTSMAVPLMPQVVMPQQQGHPGMMPHGPSPHQHQPPPPMMMPPPQQQQQGPLPPPPPPPHAMLPSVPVAVPVARAPWSTATQIMPPYPPAPRVLLCHPRAAPIPAAQLASKYMSPRDIAYVVHSILKALNANSSTSPTDYDEQWFARQTGTSVPTSRSYAQSRTNQNESTDAAQPGVGPLESRAERSKAWSTQHAALGHNAKTNVARPRALIANPALSATANSDAAGGDGGGSEQENAKKQRAVLWKARLYCDRAYQAFFAVMETWQSSHNVAQVQPHLMKLLKCLGVTSSAARTKPNAPASQPATTLAVIIDPEPLQLVCKLNKGRILLARIMEQALLPPQAMSSMLPTVWSVCLSAGMAPSLQRGMMTTTMLSDPTDDRLFAALARVLTSLPNLDEAIALACLQTILKQPSKAVLESTVRMQAAHALLQRGASLVTAPGGQATLAAEWSKAEDEFMQLLQGQR